MKRPLVFTLMLICVCAASTAARAASSLIIVNTSTGTPVACAPPGVTLGTLPACAPNTGFSAFSFSLSFSNPGSGEKPFVSDVSLTKTIDGVSAGFTMGMVQGKSIGNVLISVYSPEDIAKAGTGTPLASYTIQLTDVFVDSISDGGFPYQSVSLAYGTIVYRFNHHDSGTPAIYKTTYNVLTNTVS